MPVGSHKDSFKAHQIVKKLAGNDSGRVLAKMAADIILDFVKSQRQICAEKPLDILPPDLSAYELEKLDQSLIAVDALCGKCEESHDNACFVNQARRALIAAKTGADLGTSFDGRKTIDELIKDAQRIAEEKKKSSVPSQEDMSRLNASFVVEDRQSALVKELEGFREREIFRDTLTDEIVETIRSVSSGNYAAEMPVHDDPQLGKLASAFNMMLKAIKETVSNLDHLVAERSGELKQIMNTVPAGIISINPEGRVNPEHSLSSEDILGQRELPGRDFADLLGLTRRRENERQQLLGFLDFFRQGLIPEEDMAGLNPFPEIELESESSASKWIKLSYHMLSEKAGADADILVIIEDITRQKELALENERAESENTHLRALAEDPDLFRDFLSEMKKVLVEASEAIDYLKVHPGSLDTVNRLYRGVHTIKGVAASMGLRQIVAATGSLEEKLSGLRGGDELTAELAEETIATIKVLDSHLHSMSESASKLLGTDGLCDHDIHLKISLKKLKDFENRLKKGNTTDASTIAFELVKSLQELSAKTAFARTTKMISGLAQRLGKNVNFVFEGAETPVNCEVAKLLNAALVHLIRNALDHGIECPEDRIEEGKSDTAILRLRVLREDSNLTLEVIDDGRGIDPLKMRAAAVKKGFLSADETAALSDIEAQKLIFRPVFSSAESVTDVSGRGVGMDAVLATVRNDLRGSIDLNSFPGRGTTVKITVPL